VPYLLHALSHESTDDAFVDGSVVPICPRVSGYVATVAVEDNQWVHKGELLLKLDPKDFEARRDATLAALNAARAAARSGDIEVSLTRISASAGLDEAQAAVAAAEAGVKNGEAQVAAAQSLQDQARAQLALTRAALAQAKAESASEEAAHRRDAMDLKRIRKMAENGTVSGQQLDHAVATEGMSAAALSAAQQKIDTQKAMVDQAAAALSAAADNLRQARAQLDARRAQQVQSLARLHSAQAAPQQVEQSHSRAEVSRADIDRAAAELEQARLQLSYTKIVSPVDGYVTRKTVEEGAFVQAGQELMAVIPPEVWVTANFKETQLTRMRPGQPATIRVDTYPDVAFAGHVDSIQHGTGARFSLLPPENATGNFIKVVQRVPVKIVFDRLEQLKRHRLVLGLSAVPEVDVSAKPRPDPARKTDGRTVGSVK
jgi:membrane fusion protein (multidrug efflux system)